MYSEKHLDEIPFFFNISRRNEGDFPADINAFCKIVVPSYEVVPVLHTVHKRSVDAKPQIHLKAFGKDISLSLKPTEGLLTANSLPMWTVTRNASQPDGLHYERVKDVSDLLSAHCFFFSIIENFTISPKFKFSIFIIKLN